MCLLAASWPDAAYAAFPGKNGRIAFHTNRDGNFEIYVMDADGAKQTNLTDNPAFDVHPAWSPDGTKTAFVTNRDGVVEIYVMGADGSNPTRLTNTACSNSQPVWSPDGTKITFTSGTCIPGITQIHVMNANGSNEINVSNDLGKHDEQPSWSPDGTKIAFSRGDPGTVSSVWVMNADGSNQTDLTPDLFPHNTSEPDWSPDGTRILFVSTFPSGTSYEIYVMNANGSGRTRLTNDNEPERHPIWSPDGTKIAFARRVFFDGNTVERFDIYVMNANGSNATRLTNNVAFTDYPAWRVRSLLVIDTQAGTGSRGGLFRVNPITGARTLLSDFGNSAQGPRGNATTAGVAVEADNGILVTDRDAGAGNSRGTLFRVNPTTGFRAVLSDFSVSGQGPRGQDPFGVAVEDDGNVLVSDITAGNRGALFRVDPNTGARILLSNFGNNAQGPRGATPAGVAVEAGGTIPVSDFSAGTGGRGVLFQVNPITGLRALLNDFGNSVQGPRGVDPVGVAVEPVGTILVVDISAGTGGRGALFRVDSGARTVLSNFGASGQGPLGVDPIAVTVEPEGSVLISDVTAGTGARGALFRVDAVTGTRTLLSNFGNNAQGPLGMNPSGVAVD